MTDLSAGECLLGLIVRAESHTAGCCGQRMVLCFGLDKGECDFFWGGDKKAEVVEFQRLPLEKGVQDESRTHTPNRALPPQSSASTNSATWTSIKWSDRRDSDPRPRPWQGRALPTELLSQKSAIVCGFLIAGTKVVLYF